jgi:hypothetical protein
MANVIGRTAAWAGLLMVLIQVMIVFLQRIFRVAAIELGPLGTALTYDLSWWAEGLKFWNAMVVCLCVSYTFVQGGHVRVDLVYSAVKHRTKRVDRHVRLPVLHDADRRDHLPLRMVLHVAAPDDAVGDLHQRSRPHAGQARIFRWNVETIGFSPNGFNAYFLFKVLIVLFCVAGLPAGGGVLLAVLPRMGRGRGKRGQVPRPRPDRRRGRGTGTRHSYGIDLSGQGAGRGIDRDEDRAGPARRIEGKDETCFSVWMGSKLA